MDYQKLKDQFLLDKNITYLNFGSFGACPRPIFEEYQRLQLELEREPVQFITKRGNELLLQSRMALSKFINCEQEDLVYVMNPSYAVNIIAKSLELKAGDEILSTNIEYGACDKTWEYYCNKAGARYVRQKINLPIINKETFVSDFFSGCTERTKLIFVSHITSSTGLILPVEEIIQESKRRGILVFVDGAHVPGQLPLDLKALDVDIYTGACHKWMMCPKGCSFLYVKKELQERFDPLIISWGYKALFPSESLFQDYHNVQGTRDYTAFLTVPKSIEFMEENEWTKVAARCRAIVQSNAIRFCNLMDSQPISPISDTFLAQLFSIPVQTSNPEALYAHLFNEYQIEIPVMRQEDKVYVRYSIQGYNDQGDLDKLYEALKEIKEKGVYIKSE
ncbi:MAG: aminotransferase class V-fold PLP-dependent enzyme [Saprospiraceae bacterium]